MEPIITDPWEREAPPGYEITFTLRKALDRGLAAWRAAPPGEARYLSLATLHAALRYLQAGYRVDGAHRELILRSALHHGAGILTALAHQREAETVAAVVVDALVIATTPLAQETLWHMQGAPVGYQEQPQTTNRIRHSTRHVTAPQSWEALAAQRLRQELPNLGLRRRAHVAAALYQLETGLPVLETMTRQESAPDNVHWAGNTLAARRFVVLALGGILFVAALLFFFPQVLNTFLPPGFQAERAEIVTVPSGYYPVGVPDNALSDFGEEHGGESGAGTAEDAEAGAVSPLALSEIYVESYSIMVEEVTNRAYRECVSAGACRPPVTPDSATRVNYFLNPDYDAHPVVQVRWQDAVAYCAWREMRLPTAREWEVASGYSPLTERRYRYPWGDRFEPRFTNFRDSAEGDTRPVGSFHPHGNSPLGLRDMAGNVAEWTASPGHADREADLPALTGDVAWMIVKGGSFLDEPDALTVYAERLVPVTTGTAWLGFRCAH